MVLVSTQKLEFWFILVSPQITYIAPLKTLDIDHRDLKKTLGLDFTELVTLSKKPDTSRITGALNCHAITLDQWLWLRQKIIIQLMKFTWYSFYWMGKKMLYIPYELRIWFCCQKINTESIKWAKQERYWKFCNQGMCKQLFYLNVTRENYI